MRVDSVNNVTQLYKISNTVKVGNDTVLSKSGEKYELSQMGKDYQVAKSALEKVPVVREDLVAAYKAQIDAGTYDVDSEDFADKMLNKLEF